MDAEEVRKRAEERRRRILERGERGLQKIIGTQSADTAEGREASVALQAEPDSDVQPAARSETPPVEELGQRLSGLSMADERRKRSARLRLMWILDSLRNVLVLVLAAWLAYSSSVFAAATSVAASSALGDADKGACGGSDPFSAPSLSVISCEGGLGSPGGLHVVLQRLEPLVLGSRPLLGFPVVVTLAALQLALLLLNRLLSRVLLGKAESADGKRKDGGDASQESEAGNELADLLPAGLENAVQGAEFLVQALMFSRRLGRDLILFIASFVLASSALPIGPR
eukprot:tig00021123_g18489.t1